ncbi:TPA: hypothetical protein HA219_00345 [Candidatus Woesearchaeota archaeon]|nr:hypothetical protein [Candidatus Woesearchaeota archaeon]HIH39163.1 hypothetical protein [Candidatus Woesearchaeota archaeon]
MKGTIYLEAFINRGNNRKQILKALLKGRKTQAELHKTTGMYRTHVRRTLLELMEKRVVKCQNPKDRTNKWYEITELGKEVLGKLE